MVKAVFDELDAPAPRRHFTVGIVDDVTGTLAAVADDLDIEPADEVRAVFYGLGSDGTVGANKNSIKIIGEDDRPLRAGLLRLRLEEGRRRHRLAPALRSASDPRALPGAPGRLRRLPPVRLPRAPRRARRRRAGRDRPAERALRSGRPSGTTCRARCRRPMLEKRLRLFVIDAYAVARELGLGGRINTIMQACFFALAGVLPRDEAVARIKDGHREDLRRKGAAVVRAQLRRRGCHAGRAARGARCPSGPSATRAPPTGRAARGAGVRAARHRGAARRPRRPAARERVPRRRHLAARHGPLGEAQPRAGDPGVGRGPLHPVQQVRAHVPARRHPGQGLRARGARRRRRRRSRRRRTAPASSAASTTRSRWRRRTARAAACASRSARPRTSANPRHKAIDMAPAAPLAEPERANYAFFLALPEPDRTVAHRDVKGSQLLEPLFEYSGACAGCGETSYVKLLTQLFGDRALIANATGCSSIYGGNLPTTPFTTNREGRGPAWSNSLFEDNAEFGLGIRLAVDQHAARAQMLLRELAGTLGDTLVRELLDATQHDEAGIAAQRARVAALRTRLAGIDGAAGARARAARRLSRAQERVDRRRRRLGLRHRLRRAGPRARARPRRQHPRARHRGVLEHRRPAIEGDAAGRRGQVRRGRQAGAEEGPGPHGHGERPRLRRARRARRPRRPGGARLPGGRVVSRARR